MPAVQTPCPDCGSRNTFVVCTNSTDDGIVRRRKCVACEHRWYSHQPHEKPVPSWQVVTVNKKPTLRAAT